MYGTPEGATVKTPVEAARAFEGMLLQQLFKEMTRTVGKSELMGSGFESDLYNDMFASALADSAAGGESGLSVMLRKAFNAEEPTVPAPAMTSAGGLESLNRLRSNQMYRAGLTGTAQIPHGVELKRVVDEWIPPGAETRWGKNGVLGKEDLSAQIQTAGTDGDAFFNVEDASGYEGYPKCNLFAFELFRRAGYSVPVVARERGWGFPGADAVTRMANAGDVSQWAQVRSGESAEALDAIATSGQPLLVTSDGIGKPGHMAVMDRVHNVTRTSDGSIASIEYSGWEAGGSKAGYGRHVWHLSSVQGSGLGGLSRIEVLKPHTVESGEAFVAVNSNLPGGSLKDAESSNVHLR